MTRTTIPSRDEAPVDSQATLDAVKARMGALPNVFRVLAISPKALKGTVALQAEMFTTLTPRQRDHVALAVSQVNGCHYCLSAHSFVAANFTKMQPAEIATARTGTSADAKEAAVAAFSKKVTETRGKVSDADLAAIRAAGFTEAQIVDIIVLCATFLLTNFINNVFDTEIDFPIVSVAPETA